MKALEDFFKSTNNLGWIIVVLILFGIILFSNLVIDNQVALDIINVSATVVSIILAVLSIIYSFFVSSTSSTSTEKMKEAAESLEKSKGTLDESLHKLDLFGSELEKNTNLINDFYHTLRIFESKYQEHISEQKIFMNNLDQKFTNAINDKSTSIIRPSESSSFIDKIPFASFYILIFMAYLIRLAKKDGTYDESNGRINRVSFLFNSNHLIFDKSKPYLISKDYIHGCIVGISSTGNIETTQVGLEMIFENIKINDNDIENRINYFDSEELKRLYDVFSGDLKQFNFSEI